MNEILIGRRISGRYKVLEVIGGGGMANVYLARDMILDRDVAIKILRFDFSNDDDFIKRFRREAHAATSLAHPNIVSIYDVGEEDDIYYIVMEYVNGKTLKQYIQQYAPLHPKEALHIMEQLTSAISHAHLNHIVHRDIKPQNILIDHDGIVKVTDFGIALALSSTTITQTNSVLGTVHYLSPEQARGGMATKKSDIYSLGIVMFELLTGRIPFEGESAVSIALKHLQSETPSPKRWNPSIPQSVENIILKATTKDTFYRYESVDEMEEDLRTALHPERLHEEKFSIQLDDDEITKAIPIIKDQTLYSKPPDTIVRKQDQPNPTEAKEPVKPKKKKNKLLIILLSIFFFIVAAGVASVTIFPSLFLPDDVKVPDVTGMEYEDAYKKLADAGFRVGKKVEKEENEIPEGHVIKTDPEAGESVKEKSTIIIYQSSGKEKVEFDDYVGEDIEQVEDKLRKLEFLAVHTTPVFDESEPGTILSQSIDEGEKVVPEETEVTFEVSQGPEKVTLRDLRGYNETALNDYAEAEEINIVYLERVHDEKVAEGLVISQNPPPNTEIGKDQKVEVVLSKGPLPKEDKTVTRKIRIPYDPETEGQPQHVQIMIQDKDHSITDVYEEFEIIQTATKELKFTIPFGTEGKYLLFVDGIQVDGQTIPYPE